MKSNITVLKNLMPRKPDKDFGPATMHDDGSIEYEKREKDWEPPRDIDGFVRDENNHWLFHPIWPECGARRWAANVKPCGCVEVSGICKAENTDTYNQRVNFKACSQCPLMNGGPRPVEPIPEPRPTAANKPCVGCPDSPALPTQRPAFDAVAMKMPQVYTAPQYPPGHHPLWSLQFSMPFDTVQREYSRPVFHTDGSIEYPRLSHQTIPPDDIDGYQRDEKNPWRFKPLWPDCSLRFHSIQLKQNGCVQAKMICQNPQAPEFGKPVNLTACTNCPVRRAVLQTGQPRAE